MARFPHHEGLGGPKTYEQEVKISGLENETMSSTRASNPGEDPKSIQPTEVQTVEITFSNGQTRSLIGFSLESDGSVVYGGRKYREGDNIILERKIKDGSIHTWKSAR